MNMRNKPGGEDIICDCKFGAIGEELANEQFLLPELPTGRVKCMFGSFTEKGYGRTRVQEFKKEFQFCYMATCASAALAVMVDYVGHHGKLGFFDKVVL
uniref:SECA_MOTOR_DEAD domain-containing protein n=1 Tax=Globodera pallida TaxID=36090 RepID=A0A183C3G7_GLOPA